MSVKIIIIGDTHLNSFKKLPKEMGQAIKEGDWIIHVGGLFM
jgi:predicted phosphodiesterase